MAILESRLPPAISQNESDIDSLRIKQKYMEIVMRKQQETNIGKLSEENKLIKSKLKVIDK
jgi:hypothetical protein